MCSQIRVLLLARNRLLREALGRVLRKNSDILLQTGDEASLDVDSLARKGQIDVILIDPQQATNTSLECVQEICRSNSKVHVVMLGVEGYEPRILPAVQAGLSGYLAKDVSIVDVVAAIRTVANGRS